MKPIIFRLSVLSLCFFLIHCEKKEAKKAFKPNTGQIQILNACGYSGAAEEMRNFLTQKGFDVVEFGNADSWNYKKTIVVARTQNVQIAHDLGIILSTDKVIQLIDSSQMVDATIFVGKDYYERLAN